MIEYHVGLTRKQLPMDCEPFHRYVFPDETVWTEFFRVPEGYLLRFPGLADFVVSADGERVQAYPLTDTSAGALEHLYINQVFPLALSRQGRPAFHASVVTAGDGVVAFMGASGMGKSTLATAFARNGASFLTDDGMLIEESASGVMVLPNHPSVRLWDDSVAALIDSDMEKAPEVSFTNKSRLIAGDRLPYCDEPKRLLAVFVLNWEEVPKCRFERLHGVAQVMAWLSHSFLLDVGDRDLIARHFEWTHRVSSVVPTFALDYPRDYKYLPAVRECVLRQLQELEG